MKRNLLACIFGGAYFFSANDLIAQTLPCPNEVVIGTTQFNQQANKGNTGRRIFEWNDHTMGATWILTYTPPFYTDRGTGYNYFDGGSWDPVPSSRIEPVRTGFPNMFGSIGNGEFIFSHTSGGDYSSKRSIKGTGTWIQSDVPGMDLRWLRFTIGGINNQTIHLIGSNDIYSTGGLSNSLRYWRSPDLGLTWDIQDMLIPFVDSTNLFAPQGDAYSISSRGNVVAFTIGGFTNDLILCKSVDNGNTWTKTVVNQFPIPLFDPFNNITDVNNDGIADTITTTDLSNSIIIDHNSVVHVWTGKTKVLDLVDTIPGGYFPYEDGVLYWNETYGPNTILNYEIAGVEDIDNDGILNFNIYPCNSYHECSASSMVSGGVDSLNNLYLFYSAYVEDTANPFPTTDTSFHNVYFTYSTDYGVTWSTPYRLCPDDRREQLFPSMAENVIGNPKVIYCRDSLNVFSPNYLMAIVYSSPSISTVISETFPAGFSLFPNPANNVLSIQSKTANTTVTLHNTLGEQLLTKQFKEKTTIDISRLPQGIYFVTLSNDDYRVTKKVVRQ